MTHYSPTINTYADKPKSFNNYRITFGGHEIDYHHNFKDCKTYYPVIKEIFDAAKERGIEYIWFFFEPYVEITWIGDGSFLYKAEEIAKKHGCKDIALYTPHFGNFADWYGMSFEELEYGYKRYSKTSELVMLMYEHRDLLENGMGWENHFVRCTHALANPLAMNYKEEGIHLMKRSILCLLYWYLSPKWAIRIYKFFFDRRWSMG